MARGERKKRGLVEIAGLEPACRSPNSGFAVLKRNRLVCARCPQGEEVFQSLCLVLSLPRWVCCLSCRQPGRSISRRLQRPPELAIDIAHARLAAPLARPKKRLLPSSSGTLR